MAKLSEYGRLNGSVNLTKGADRSVIKKCPTCGSKKIKGKLICPDCGYQIKEQDQHTNEEKNNSQLPIDSSEEHFPDTELNDPIEWSELTE